MLALLPFLNLTLSYNAGAAFGFLNEASGWQNIVFVSVAVIAAVFILQWLRRLSSHERALATALCLILGGALGNLTDRLHYGHVVDFIDVVFGSWHFWTFNVADSAICIGAAVLILDAFGAMKGSSKQVG